MLASVIFLTKFERNIFGDTAGSPPVNPLRKIAKKTKQAFLTISGESTTTSDERVNYKASDGRASLAATVQFSVICRCNLPQRTSHTYYENAIKAGHLRDIRKYVLLCSNIHLYLPGP